MDPDNPARVVPELYEQLRELAERHFAHLPANHTLQPTAVVNEAYLKLARGTAEVGSRTHFMALASRVMRQVLVDHARAQGAAKRDRGGKRITLMHVAGETPMPDVNVLDVEAALAELARLSDMKARLIELRFFGGLSEAQAADELGISRSSASRHWRMARAWLTDRLTQDEH